MVASMTRRGFMQTGTAAALGVGLSPALGLAGQRERKNDKQDLFGGFIVGMQSYTFRNFSLEQALPRTRDLGLHFMEFYRGHIPVNSTDDQIKAIRAMCFKYDITPIAFGVESFSSDNAANRRIFEFARKLGVRYLSADPSP